MSDPLVELEGEMAGQAVALEIGHDLFFFAASSPEVADCGGHGHGCVPHVAADDEVPNIETEKRGAVRKAVAEGYPRAMMDRVYLGLESPLRHTR